MDLCSGGATLQTAPPGAEMTSGYMSGPTVDDDRVVMLGRLAFRLSNPGPSRYEFRIHGQANRVCI